MAGENGAFVSPKKKSLEPESPKDCTLIYFILDERAISNPYRKNSRAKRQVFWLTDRSTFRTFPGFPSGLREFRPRLQRRDRSRFSRDSLLSYKAPDRHIFNCSSLLSRLNKPCQVLFQNPTAKSRFVGRENKRGALEACGCYLRLSESEKFISEQVPCSYGTRV